MPNKNYRKGSTFEARFYDKVEKTGSCWNWTGYVIEKGYGQFRCGDKVLRAHRFSYELVKGKIPLGLQIDHLCRNRKCVNPEHLEVVTPKENCRRGLSGIATKLRSMLITHCPKGHEYSKENTYVRKNGRGRRCKICERIRVLKYYYKNKEILIGK